EPTVFARGRARHKLMTKLACFTRAAKNAGKTVAFGNHAKEREKGIADDLFLLASEKLLAREVDAGQTSGQILGEDHIAGLFHQIAVTRFETRPFEETRDFRNQTRR